MGFERLNAIIQLVDKHSIVADIGTDHGIIPICLMEKNIAKKVIATDISDKSISKLREKLELNGETRIEIRVCDGLEQIRPFEVDTIIISGMGGFLIKDILEKNLQIAKSANTLILEANNGNYELRKFLLENNFQIDEEKDLYENEIYYQILKVSCGKMTFEKEYEYEFGAYLIEQHSPNLLKFIRQDMDRLSKILAEIGQETESMRKRKQEIEARLQRLEEVRRRLEAE